MPYHLEHFGDKAIVVNTKTGRHHSLKPIPLVNAKAQMRLLETVTKKENPSSYEEPKPLFKKR